MSKKIKLFALVTLIIAALIGASVFFGKSSDTAPTTSDGPLSSSADASKAAGVAEDDIGAPPSEFSTILASITSISLDTSLFEDPAYKALRDYPITLGSDRRGRPNPFAPVGYDIGSISGAASTTEIQFETLQPAKITATTAELGAQGILSTTDEAYVVFEYGTNDLLGSATAPVALNKSGTAVQRIMGLSNGTTYFVRATLAQGSISKTGNTMTFTTSAR